MTESEAYWLGLVDELVNITEPLRGSSGGDLEEQPAWVDKLTFELFNMMTPKMQLRAGMKATPDKIGVIVGSNFVQMAQAAAFSELPKPTSKAGLSAFRMGWKLGSPAGFDAEVAYKNLPGVRDKIGSVVARVLRERPREEVSEFFRGFSRGLKQNSKSLVPEVIDGIPRFTPQQLGRLGTMLVYTVARHNWREIDKLETSQQAFQWFEKRLPAALLGNDPERIRKMFYRVGKTFKRPGRPKKRTGS